MKLTFAATAFGGTAFRNAVFQGATSVGEDTGGIADRIRLQSAVYWRRTGIDINGHSTFQTPFKVRVRWQKSTKKLVLESSDVYMSRDSVFVGFKMTPGDYLYLGSTIGVEANPLNQRGALQVRKVTKINNVGGNRVVRRCFL